jgi:uncharacterized protein (TIGR02145 family)
MNKKNIFFLFLGALILLVFLQTCKEKPVEPQYSNIFDPVNKQTNGDPFILEASIVANGVTLSWHAINNDNLYGYKVYRSTAETGIYQLLSQLLRHYGIQDTSYTDLQVANGNTYWYRITAVDYVDRESNPSKPISIEVNFYQTGTVTDIDDNIYQTVKIGNQWWMAENLKVTHYRNGDAIPNITDDEQWSSLTTGAYCNYNITVNVAVHGRLYNWYVIEDSRNIAPAGWHVPTDDDWIELELYLGMYQDDVNDEGWRGTDIGTKMKSAGSGWYGEDSYGFSALPSGYRAYYSDFFGIGDYTFWWTATEYDATYAWYRQLSYANTRVNRDWNNKKYGYSVRCVMD